MHKLFTILKISILFLYSIFFLSWSEIWAISFSMLPNILSTSLSGHISQLTNEKSFTFFTLRGYILNFPLPFSHFLNKSYCDKRYREIKEEGGVIRRSYYLNNMATGIDIHTFIFCFLGACFVSYSNGSATSEDLFWKLDALQMFVFDLHWPEPEFAHHLEQRLKLMATDMIEACVKRYSWNDHLKIERDLKINTGGLVLACRGISIPESCHWNQGTSKEIMTSVYFQYLAISNLATSRKYQGEFLYLLWIDPWKWINQVFFFFLFHISGKY